MKLLFLGDFCVSSSNVPVITPAMRSLFLDSDLVCLNFEGPLGAANQIQLSKAGPSISQSDTAVALCHEMGITHCSLANNHIMDYGAAGLKKTLSELTGIVPMGAGFSFDEAYRYHWFETGGQRVALFCFAEAQFGILQDSKEGSQAGYAWVDHPRARQAVIDAKTKADWVIVQVHAGLEMVDLPLPEWRLRYRELIDLGADLVIGHHPHMIQGSESYRGKMIHYSLGNFYMDIMLQQQDQGSGAALMVTIDGVDLASEIIPVKVSLSSIDIDQSTGTRAVYTSLCDRLSDQTGYYREIQEICDTFWKDVYAAYYESALMGLGTKPRLANVFRILKSLLKGGVESGKNETLLMHNIRIETHRWAVERALSRLSKFDSVL